MMTTMISDCATCKHYKSGDVCKAFPKGISKEILVGKRGHRSKIEGDNGVQYEKEKI